MAYKSVVLAPGESYILPPGATVLSVSKSSIYTSENNCAPLTNVEPLGCYAVILGEAKTDSPQPIMSQVVITGLRLDNVLYPITQFSLGALVGTIRTSIDTSPFGSSLTDLQVSNIGDVFTNGTVAYIVFKTISSIANDLYFVGTGLEHVRTTSGGTTPRIPVEYKVMTYAAAKALPSGTEPAAWPVCESVN
jgi:hypothetical protein